MPKDRKKLPPCTIFSGLDEKPGIEQVMDAFHACILDIQEGRDCSERHGINDKNEIVWTVVIARKPLAETLAQEAQKIIDEADK